MSDPHNLEIESQKNHHQNKRKRGCCIVSISILFFLLTLLITFLILAFTTFKPKDPKTQLMSAKINGLSPRISLTARKIEFNITIDLEILVTNPNHASFKHGQGQSLVFYRNIQVGEVDLFPGDIPARGNETMKSRLSIQAGQFGSELNSLISDVIGGEITIETKTRVPGRVTVLGFIKKHVVALSDCEITIGFPDLKLRRQLCRNKTKL